jgi:hypothetical protein
MALPTLAHHYHPDTNIYLGSSAADESPLEPSVFLVPAFATLTAPSAEPADGQVHVWDATSCAWTCQDRPADPAADTALPPIPEELPDAMTQLRAYRDRLLAESDWVAIKYFTRSEPYPVEWLVYVQSLRNLPENSTPTLNEDGTLDMASFQMPEKPASA